MANCVRVRQSLQSLCCDGESVTGQATVVLKGSNTTTQLFDPISQTWITPGTVGVFIIGSEPSLPDTWITCPLPCLEQLDGPGGETAYQLGFYYQITVFVEGIHTTIYNVALDCTTLGATNGDIVRLEDVILLSPIDSPGNPNEIIVGQYETVTTLANNGNGTYTYTNEAGATTTIAGAGGDTGVITTLIDNGDGTLTYTNEAGSVVTIDYGGAETVTTLTNNVGASTFVYTNEGGATTTVNYGSTETVTNLVNNTSNSTFTYTNEAGAPITVDYSNAVTTLTDNDDGTYTYTNENGMPVSFVGSASALFSDTLCDSLGSAVLVTGTINSSTGALSNLNYTYTNGSAYVGAVGDLVACDSGFGINEPEVGEGAVLPTDGDGVELFRLENHPTLPDGLYWWSISASQWVQV